VALSLTWLAANVLSQTKPAVARAMQITSRTLGAALGDQLFRPTTSLHDTLGMAFARDYRTANLIVTSIIWAVFELGE